MTSSVGKSCMVICMSGGGESWDPVGEIVKEDIVGCHQ